MKRIIPFHITQASLNQTAFDFPRNLKNIYAAIDKAVDAGSNLLSLEELTLTGYDAGDDFQKTDNKQIAAMLRAIARYANAKNPQLIISIGHPYYLAKKDVAAADNASERRKNALYNRINLPFNVQSFIGNGQILGMTAKQYLFNYERGYEKRYFSEWSMADANAAGGKFGTIDIAVPGQKAPVPFGRPILHLQGKNGGINLTHVICEEKWIGSRYDSIGKTDKDFAQDGVLPEIAAEVGREGLVAVTPNGSPPSRLKIDKHIHLGKLANRFADAVVDTDGLGTSGSTFAQYGYQLVMQDGKLAAYGQRLSFDRVVTTSSSVMLAPAANDSVAKAHTVLPYIFSSGTARPSMAYQKAAHAWDNPANPARETEETVRMAALWLFDYMRKTKCQGIVEALSGGADSAFNTVVVAQMVRLAVAELGIGGFCEAMPHLKYKQEIIAAAVNAGSEEAGIQVCLQNMLTTVYLGTDNNSEDTLNAARFLIEGGEVNGEKIAGIGGVFMTRNIQDLLNSYALTYAVPDTRTIKPRRKAAIAAAVADYLNLKPLSVGIEELEARAATLRKKFPEITGTLISAADPHHAIAYENIQARARQVVVNMIANAEGKMAIANPNKDEGRNSYSTFGGDLHSGTINLNGFIDKTRQLKIMRHLCDYGLQGLAAVRSLYKVLVNKPSAELQPRDASGVVTQTDETALQRTFAQMNRLSVLMLQERAGHNKERRLHAEEVFAAAGRDILFQGTGSNELYNKVRLSYQSWWLSQYKIHAAPITPTDGESVDHQTSLRTPNLSGQDRAELTQLGVKLLFAKARAECSDRMDWSKQAEKKWLTHALMDEHFVDAFEREVKRDGSVTQTFNLDGLFARAKDGGMHSVFGPIKAYYRPAPRTASPTLLRLVA